MRIKSISVILKLFDADQIKRLESFAISPYFNSKVEVSKFIEFHILKRDTSLNELELNQQSYNYVYENLEFKQKKLNHLKERAIKVIEDFIIVEANLKDEVNCLTTLLVKYGEWRSTTEYEVVSQNLEKFLGQEKNVDHNFIQNLYQIYLVKNNYSHNDETKKYDELLQNTSDKLDIYYIQAKLRIAYEVYRRDEWKHSKTYIKLLNEIIAIVDKNDYRKDKFINMYYLFLKSTIEPDVLQHYYELKNLLLNQASDFTEGERGDLLTVATNYCIHKINNGDDSYNEEIFNLFEHTIGTNILLYRSEFSGWLFTNIVIIAVKLNKIEWAENFVHSHNKYVICQWNNSYYYNLAFIEFEKSNIELAHKYLLMVDDLDVFYMLRSKCLLLKIYYEKKELPPLISLLGSFRKLLIRNKVLNDSQKMIYTNFVKYLNSIVLIPNGDSNKIYALRAKVENDHVVPFRSWLIKCIDKKMR